MRSSFEIIAEILKISKNGAKKTRIMYTCGLSYRFVQKYLDLLLKTGLLRIGNSYHTTDKGMGFLRKYQILDLLLNTRNWSLTFSISGKVLCFPLRNLRYDKQNIYGWRAPNLGSLPHQRWGWQSCSL